VFARSLRCIAILACLSVAQAYGAVSQVVTEIVFKENIAELMLAGETWKYANGDSYTGYWLHNKPHGKGTYQRLSGDVYTGDFRNGYMHGVGTYKSSNGDVYKGEFSQGLATGYGELQYQNGNRYVGQWLAGTRHGQGKLFYRSGSIYDGSWINDAKEGKGLMTYRNGERYLGDYKSNLLHGHGIKIEADGSSYRGTFSKGLKHGVGECSLEGGVIHVCLYDKGREIRDPAKLELAKAYYEKHQPVYEFDGGIAYHIQDEFTKARAYINTRNVWWEKTIALLETQLRIRSEDDDQFLYLIVNRYTGPGVYHLRKGEILASSLDGAAIELPDDIVAHIEIKTDEQGEIHGIFNIPELAHEESNKRFKIYGGRFEAQSQPPEIPEPKDRSEFLAKNRGAG